MRKSGREGGREGAARSREVEMKREETVPDDSIFCFCVCLSVFLVLVCVSLC